MTAANALTTPVNKGHESMAYLTYLIDNYAHLPSTIAFLHAHRSGFLNAWHVDASLHDNVAAMRTLQLPFVQENGYVNLRCKWNPGCVESHRLNRHVTEEVWREVFDGTSTPPLLLDVHPPLDNGDDVDGDDDDDDEQDEAMYEAAAAAAAERGKGLLQQNPMFFPRQVGAACCAQFAVSRNQVLRRPREDYIRFREWVTQTDRDSASSGRVMEFLWHVIFGKEAV